MIDVHRVADAGWCPRRLLPSPAPSRRPTGPHRDRRASPRIRLSSAAVPGAASAAGAPARSQRQKPRERDRRRIPDGWVESTEPFSRAFPVGKGATLMLSNISGNIQVTTGSGERIEVEALKHAWGPKAEQAKQRLGDALIETYATGNRVELRVEQRGAQGGRGVDVEFNVKVPADTTVDLRTVSGDIRVDERQGRSASAGRQRQPRARRHARVSPR